MLNSIIYHYILLILKESVNAGSLLRDPAQHTLCVSRKSGCAQLPLRSRRRIRSQRICAAAASSQQTVADGSVSIVLLAGGVGKRMGVCPISSPEHYGLHRFLRPEIFTNPTAGPQMTYNHKTNTIIPLRVLESCALSLHPSSQFQRNPPPVLSLQPTITLPLIICP